MVIPTEKKWFAVGRLFRALSFGLVLQAVRERIAWEQQAVSAGPLPAFLPQEELRRSRSC